MLLVLTAPLFAATPITGPDAVPEASFGTDVSVGAGAGALLGEWPDPGVHGAVNGRVDLFMVDRDTPGPRFGASAWARTAVWPLQTHTPDDPESAVTPFGLTQYGLAAILRFDPSTRWTGTFGFGFGRTDLTNYEGGSWVVPVFQVEAGLRQAVGRAVFVDYGAQSGWGSARGTGGDLEDWWTVSAGVSVGYHAR